MPEQQLAGAQVAGAPVDQRDLRPAQAVRAVARWVEADQRHPLVDEPPVLSRRQMFAGTAAAWKQPVTCSQSPQLQPSRQRLAGRLGQLERDGAAGLLLDDGGTQADAVVEVRQLPAGGRGRSRAACYRWRC